MPAYNTTSPAPTLGSGGSPTDVFSAEVPTSGELSQQLELTGVDNAIAVTLSFSGDPGPFEFDIMEADVDSQTNYVPVPGAPTLTQVNENFVARVDLPDFLGAYIAVLCKWANANGVQATVGIRKSTAA